MKLHQWLTASRGRANDLACFLQISAVMVSDWKAGRKPVPLDHCPLIQRFTDNQVTCEELRPDKAEHFALVRQLPVSELITQELIEQPTHCASVTGEGSHAAA